MASPCAPKTPASLGIRRTFRHHAPECPTMNWAGPITGEAFEVSGGPIPLVESKPIARISKMVVIHQVVPGDFGDNRRCGNHVTEGIASDHRTLRERKPPQGN